MLKAVLTNFFFFLFFIRIIPNFPQKVGLSQYFFLYRASSNSHTVIKLAYNATALYIRLYVHLHWTAACLSTVAIYIAALNGFLEKALQSGIQHRDVRPPQDHMMLILPTDYGGVLTARRAIIPFKRLSKWCISFSVRLQTLHHFIHYTEAIQRSPKDAGGWRRSKASSILPSVVFPSSFMKTTSTSPKSLIILNVIKWLSRGYITNVHMNRMAGWLERIIGKYAEGGIVIVQGAEA
jgi:hypothetical protein